MRGLGMKTARNVSTWSFSDWSSAGDFYFTNAASLIKQFIPFVNWQFCCRFPSKHRTKSPLHCNRRPRLVKPQHTFCFFYLRRHFNTCESSASGGKIWKLKWRLIILPTQMCLIFIPLPFGSSKMVDIPCVHSLYMKCYGINLCFDIQQFLFHICGFLIALQSCCSHINISRIWDV
jgi:hypothetical protein